MTAKLRVALTGASGFVGGHVLQQLTEAGHSANALLRDPFKLKNKPGDLRVVEGDLFNRSALDELMRDADAVIHLVGIIAEKPSAGQTFERIHVEGTKNLIDAAKRAGITRWIHMSALGTRPNAQSEYHRTKWLAEQAVRESGLTYTIFRPSIIHGPDGEFMHMVRDFWTKPFPPFVPYFGAGLTGKGGAGRLQPVYVEDVAQCFVAALTTPKSQNEIYPLGGPEAMTWPELYGSAKDHIEHARDKSIVAVPVWYANLIAGKPLVPFNRDQVIMSQEDSICETDKAEAHFDISFKPFEETMAGYAEQM